MAIREADPIRVPLHCKVKPESLDVIDSVFPGSGNIGRKVDILAQEFSRMRKGGGSRYDERTKIADVLRFVSDPDVRSWSARRVAVAMHCSKTTVTIARKRLPPD